MSDPPNSSPARTDEELARSDEQLGSADELARTDEELDSVLAELSRASRDIAPSADFKLAITRAIEDDIARQGAEQSGEGLERSGDGARQRPSAGRAAQAGEPVFAPSWLDGVASGGRFVFVAAAAAAALALWWSSEVQSNFDDEVLATFDVVEVVE